MLCRAISTTLSLLLIMCSVGISSGCRTVRGTQHLPRQSFLFITNSVIFQACEEENGECVDIGAGMVMGSGFLVATDGKDSWGVTAGHLCIQEPPKGAKVMSAEGKELTPKISSTLRVIWTGGEWQRAVVESVHRNLDLCILRLENVVAKRIIEVSPKPPQQGDRVYVLAAPAGTFDPDAGGKGMLLTFEGYYSGKTNDIRPPFGEPMLFDAYTVPTRGGSSGSPIMERPISTSLL